jgi:replicative DNA helicase
MIIDKNCNRQILGSLMQHPQFLSETDKYSLTIDDFSTSLEKYVFMAISGLYANGAKTINPIDVENFLETSPVAKNVFVKQKGIEYLQDSIDFSSVENFGYYYNKLKKFNLLNSL